MAIDYLQGDGLDVRHNLRLEVWVAAHGVEVVVRDRASRKQEVLRPRLQLAQPLFALHGLIGLKERQVAVLAVWLKLVHQAANIIILVECGLVVQGPTLVDRVALKQVCLCLEPVDLC